MRWELLTCSTTWGIDDITTQNAAPGIRHRSQGTAAAAGQVGLVPHHHPAPPCPGGLAQPVRGAGPLHHHLRLAPWCGGPVPLVIALQSEQSAVPHCLPLLLPHRREDPATCALTHVSTLSKGCLLDM